MTKQRQAAIGGLTLLAAYGHALYPLGLAVAARRKPAVRAPVPARWPAVSVVIPAFRESAVIEAKVANVLQNGYPAAVEVIVVAEDPGSAEAARRTSARVLENPERVGKAASLNRGVAAAGNDVVVLTDADTTLLPGAIEAVARWFLDADVGAVAGEKRVAGTTGEAAYWRFEGWLKRNETRLGTTIGMSGGLVAVRKGTFRDLPLGLIPDDFWIALDVAERGMRVIYEPDAVWSDESDEENPPWARDWERRTRVVVGTLDLAWRRRRLLRPGSGVAGQLWGHRVIRSSFGPLAHGALLWIAVARFPRSPLARVFVLGHTAAAVALGRKIRGARLSAPEKMLAHLLLLQAVALGGLVRYARGDRAGLWPKDERPPTPAT